MVGCTKGSYSHVSLQEKGILKLMYFREFVYIGTDYKDVGIIKRQQRRVQVDRASSGPKWEMREVTRT